jgi:hypothetical protein
MQHLVEPLVVLVGSDKPGPSKFIDEQEWSGTRDIAAFRSGGDQFQRDHERGGEANVTSWSVCASTGGA